MTDDDIDLADLPDACGVTIRKGGGSGGYEMLPILALLVFIAIHAH